MKPNSKHAWGWGGVSDIGVKLSAAKVLNGKKYGS